MVLPLAGSAEWSGNQKNIKPGILIRDILTTGSGSFYPQDPDHFTNRIQIILSAGSESFYLQDPDHFTHRIRIILPTGSRSFYPQDPDYLDTDQPENLMKLKM